MAVPVFLIGLLIAADSVLGYQLGFERAKRRADRNALSAFEHGAFRDAFRHWALVTGLGVASGAVIGARSGPGALHGILTVAAASLAIALPLTYGAGLLYTRQARQLIHGQR